MFDFGYSVIDGHAFTDDDGSRFFYFPKIGKENIIDGKHIDHLMVARLSDDGLRLISDPVFVCQPQFPWEMQSSDTWLWNEGPFMIKHNH